MNKSLELIRQKCIEANPEIVKLNEGCIVDVNELSHTVFGKDNGKFMAYLNKPFRDDLLANDFYDCEFPEGAKDVKVIGRPIRLADVLLAIKEFVGNNDYHRAHEHWKEMVPKVALMWNLRKDDLNEQSEETINFLAELLR